MWSTWSYTTLLSILPKKEKEVCDGRSSFHNVHPPLIIIPVTITTFSVHTVINTGTTHALITRSLLQTLLHPPIQTTYTTTTVLGDAHTTISLYGMISLVYVYQSYPHIYPFFVVESLGLDLVLDMNWCHTYNIILCVPHQELLHHSQYGQTVVHFQGAISVPICLAQSIQLAPYYKHLIPLSTLLSAAN